MQPLSDTADGSVHDQDGKTVLRFERALPHPVRRVWTALTDPAEMLRWWGCADELELVEGGRFVFHWLNHGDNGERYVMHGHVTRLDPPHLLEFDTNLHGVLRFELHPDGAGTRLVFTSTLADCSADNLPLMLAGWHMHLDFLASAGLGDQEVDLVNLPLDQWTKWRDEYAARLS